MRTIYRLDDSVLAQIAKILQIALVTQTDVTDHMRQIVLEPNAEKPGNLVLTPEYKANDVANIQKLLDEAVQRLEKNANS